MPNQPLAVQMYTLRDQVAADIVGTLRAVAELGYGAVELGLGSLGGMRPAGLRPQLDALGLPGGGIHAGLDQLEGHRDDALAGVQALGARYAVCPWLPPDRRGSAEGYRAL